VSGACLQEMRGRERRKGMESLLNGMRIRNKNKNSVHWKSGNWSNFLGHPFLSTHLFKNSLFNDTLNLIYDSFKPSSVYKYLGLHFHESVFNWTFCQLL